MSPLENILSSSLAGLIAGVCLILIQLYFEKNRKEREAIKGKLRTGVLDKNFLIHHTPQSISLDKLLDYFGAPNDVQESIEKRSIYKYEFENGIAKFLIDLNGQRVVSIAFFHAGKQKVKCPVFTSKYRHPNFGNATFTQELLDKSDEFLSVDQPKLGYSGVKCRFDNVELAHLEYQYIIFEANKDKKDLLYKKIQQVVISDIYSKDTILIGWDELLSYQFFK